MSDAWENLKLLGGITDDGETFYLPYKENFTSDLAAQLLDAFQTEFGEKLWVVVDNAPYFAANMVNKFVENTPLELCHPLRGSRAESRGGVLTSTQPTLGNQLFEELDEFHDAALAALDSIEPPNLCP